MNPSLLKRLVPHLIAIVIFLLIAIIYCKPALDGKVLYQSDVMGYKAMAQESVEFKDKYGHFPLWTESMFSGMPGYNIAMSPTSNITIGYFNYLFTLGLPKPINFFFLACICFYILTQILRLNPWVGILAALAYSYSTFDPIIIAVGHETQMMAIGYAPAAIGGLLVIFQRKWLLGAALFALFFSLETSTQHLQILYYTCLMIGFITLAFLYHNWKQRTLKQAFFAVTIAVAAGITGLCAYALTLLPTREYATETMRGGKSELTTGDLQNKTKGGLDKDYAFHWSYGVPETLTLFVPTAFGGGNMGKVLTDNSKFADELESKNVPEASAIQLANANAYWGTQPGTAGPVYLGAVITFLFILGIVYVKSWHKWWILAVTVLGIAMAWGKNFAAFNYFLFDYLPLYSKFRSPTMALVIPQLTFPLLAALGLEELLKADRKDKEPIWKNFKTVLMISGGLLLMLGIFYFSTNFKGPNDDTLKQNFASSIVQQAGKGNPPAPEIQQQANAEGNALLKSLKDDRQSLFGSDLLRCLLFIGLSALLTGLYIKQKINSIILIAGLGILSTYDLLAEGRVYLNDDNFVDSADIESSFTPTPADQKISGDPDKNFRVFDETDQQNGPFNSSRSSYFHHSIGGYHPAKLGLYQDIIENQLQKGNMMVFNMLNTRYFIQNSPTTHQPQAMLNPNAFGPCWLVKSIHYVKDANEEMKALDSINVRDTAIVQKIYEHVIRFLPVPDSSSTIRLIENLNDKISYQVSAKTNQFAVFSEVYYNKGWDVYLDGIKADYCKVDYILRGMPVPSGEHKIEFRFEPHSYATGNTISILASLITYLLLIGAAVEIWRKKKTAS